MFIIGLSDSITEICDEYGELAVDYFSQQSPNVSWDFFVHRRDYQRAARALERWLQMDISDLERQEISSWLVIVSSV